MFFAAIWLWIASLVGMATPQEHGTGGYSSYTVQQEEDRGAGGGG